MMVNKLTLVEKMRKETVRGERRLKREQKVALIKANQDDLKLKKSEQKNAKFLFKEVKIVIKKSAANGKNSVSIPIMRDSREESPSVGILACNLP